MRSDSGISRGKYPNKTAVRTKIVQHILDALGWDVYNPDQVCDEYTLKLKLKTVTRRIDLALCVSNGSPRCIIELQSPAYALKDIGRSDGDRQLFEYSFHAGAPLALLTNGVNWRFYSTQSAGTYAERLVSTLDIETDPLAEVASRLERYLSYENTKLGKAADFAREDLNARLNQSKARQAIPHAWAQLVEGHFDERLAALLIEATSSLTEGSPTKQDVTDFLRSLRPEGDPRQRRSNENLKPVSTQTLAGRKAAHTTEQKPTLSGDLRYWLLGEERSAKTAIEAYVTIFVALAERDQGFPARVAPHLQGHKNRGLARTKQELSANERTTYRAAQLPGNWWLLTYMSNSQKIKSLKIACGVAGIRFGDRTGLDISLPNA